MVGGLKTWVNQFHETQRSATMNSVNIRWTGGMGIYFPSEGVDITMEALPHVTRNHIILRDFNEHHTWWGRRNNRTDTVLLDGYFYWSHVAMLWV